MGREAVCGQKQVIQRILAVKELFSTLTVAVDANSYNFGKAVWNYVHTPTQMTTRKTGDMNTICRLTPGM
jgi:hypothetical protein